MRPTIPRHHRAPVWALIALLCLAAACDRQPGADGEKLARTYCASCHAFPDPSLLAKTTWRDGVLPQMGLRVGAVTPSLSQRMSFSPYMATLATRVSDRDWQKIVDYYLLRAPDSLPYQVLPAEPVIDPAFFAVSPLTPNLRSSGIVTLLHIDSVHRRIFVGEAAPSNLRIFDWRRRLLSTLALASPPTDLIVERNRVLVLESGLLNPNDEPRGSLAEYDFTGGDSLRFSKLVLDSLIRPVFVREFDFDGDGVGEFVVCEFGDNRGRLALYKLSGARYVRQDIAATPGAIRFEIADLTGDGAPDIVALFGQADERIVLFENDGHGSFRGAQKILARFPPVYGSMHFSLHDFNGDGKLDILYVNGDNFDFSRVLKPYHGIRILENDGHNDFHERYFFPLYGAARAEAADFDGDGDLDILATSNFADSARHPDRGIMYLENLGGYRFRPYSFSVAVGGQWNEAAIGDVNGDGRPDAIVGAMNLQSIARFQRSAPGASAASEGKDLLVFENRISAAAQATGRK